MDSTLDFDACEDAEDDVFYVELKRRILLLIEDEEDEHHVVTTKSHTFDITVKPKTTNSTTGFSFSPAQHLGCYISCQKKQELGRKNLKNPSWQMNVRKDCNGTGVFIPHIVESRTTQKGKTNKERHIKYKRLQK